MAGFIKKKVLTSGLGTSEPYAYLSKPDYGNEERGFGNPRGVWKVDLTISNKDPSCQRMVDEIVKCHEESYAAAVEEYEANPPQVARGKKPLLPYEGDMPFFDNGDGTTTFKFKSYASYQDKKTKESKSLPLVVVDSQGKKIKDVPIIGGGSKLKVKYSLVPYSWNKAVGASVKLQLESVMLVELADFGSNGEDEWADEVEDGYVASAREPAEQGWEPQGEPEGDDGSVADDEDF